jgi:hypothetical protein
MLENENASSDIIFIAVLTLPADFRRLTTKTMFFCCTGWLPEKE